MQPVAGQAVYNGMPAGELGDVPWRMVISPEGPGVELARLSDGQVAMRNAADVTRGACR